MTKPVIVKRSVKGGALTFTELDTNFQNLDDATITLKAGTGGTDVVSDLNGVITLVATDGISLTGNNTAKEISIDASLVRDTTPQLGGDLDVQTYKITTSVTNGTITIEPNGTGDVLLRADAVIVGDGGGTIGALLSNNGGLFLGTQGAQDVEIVTNGGGVGSGRITMTGAANGNITIEPNGTGDVVLNADTVSIGDSGAAATLTTNGAGNLTLSTNNGSSSTTLAIANGANGNVTVTPNGTGVFNVAGGASIATRTNSTGGSIIGRAQTTTTGTYLYPSTVAQKVRTDILTAAMTNEPAVFGFQVRDSAAVTTNFGRLACTYQGTGTNPFFRFSASADNFTSEVVSVIFGGGVANWGSSGTYTHTTVGTTDLILSTNQGTNSGTIRINDGVNGNIELTPNGTGVTAVTGALTVTGRITEYDKIHGSFYHDATITPAAANTAYVIPLNTTVSAETSDISIATSTQITIAKAGIYNIQFSLQLSNTDTSNEQEFDIWLRKNGANVAASNTQVSVVKQHAGVPGKTVVALNFLVTAAASDYFELTYAVSSTSVTIAAIAAISSPYTRPSTPSVIVTVVPVGA